MATVERYGPGEQAPDFVAGDFILAHRHNLIGGLISQAQKRRFRGPDAVFAHWTHAAMVVGSDGALVEAETTGVKRSPISRYRDDEYHLVRLGSDFEGSARARAVDYSLRQVGQGFGFLEMFGAALYLLSGRPLRLVRGDHQICSGLVANALQAGGLGNSLDPALTLPADLAKLYEARP
ncbi:MAG: hypothetical protein ACREOM_06295 [Candidatus Dormibacteraceae bacterium]